MSSTTTNLSFAQTYILASKVRSKLTKEASLPKSQLRNLVVQANMLDNLMDYISIETEKRSNLQFQQQLKQKQENKLKQSQQNDIVKNQKSKVHFNLPQSQSTSKERILSDASSQNQPHFYKTSITEYEIDSDSDEEIDSESDSDSEPESESDSGSIDEFSQDYTNQINSFNNITYKSNNLQPKLIKFDHDSQHKNEQVFNSDSDNDSSDYNSDSDSDDDYYIYSDSDDINQDISSTPRSTIPITNSYKQLPFMNLSLSSIEEEEDQDELPELTKSNLLTDDDELDNHDDKLTNTTTTDTTTTTNEVKIISNNKPIIHNNQEPISLFKNDINVY